MFGMVVSQINFSRDSIDVELLEVGAVLDPVVIHVDGFLSLLF